MNPSQLVKFSLKKILTLGRKVAVGFAPAQEVMCGSAGCYANQFQLGLFLDHLSVIKMPHCLGTYLVSHQEVEPAVLKSSLSRNCRAVEIVRRQGTV